MILGGQDREYNPDKWILMHLTYQSGEEDVRVLGSWSGGYLDGDSWRASSGVVKVEEDGDYYLFHNHSGSIYRCHKKMEGMTAYTSGIFRQFENSHNAQMLTVDEATAKAAELLEKEDTDEEADS